MKKVWVTLVMVVGLAGLAVGQSTTCNLLGDDDLSCSDGTHAVRLVRR